MRPLILAILLAGSLATFVRLPSADDGAFDPLEPRGRQVERAIAEGAFETARPVAEQLNLHYPDTPVIALWLAEIYRGLGRTSDEAAALERYLQSAGRPDEVCPALPQAYRRLEDASRAIDAYRRCAQAAPDDPERLVDLADALAAAGREADESDALQHLASIDPAHPRLRHIHPATLAAGGRP